MADLQSRMFSSFVKAGVDRHAQLTNDITMASNKLAIAAESVSFTAGAAGTTGVVGLDKAPVFDATGTRVGSLGDTSLAWVTGTILTAEVALDLETYNTDAEFLATLAQGQYAIDYVLGKIYYCKATNGTSDTCNYTTRQLNVEVTAAGVGADVNVKQVGGDTVAAANTARAVTTKVVPTQPIDAAGNVLGRTAANTARTTGTLVDPVQVVDAAGKVLGTKTEHASPGATPDGLMVAGVYRAAPDVYDDGDAALLHFTPAGRLMTDVSMAATDYTDDAAAGAGGFTIGTSKVGATGFIADEAAPDSVDEGDIGIARMTLERKVHIASTEAHDSAASAYANMVGLEAKTFDGAALPNPVGAEADIVRAAGSLSGVQYIMPVNQDGSKSPIQAEDAAHTSGDVGYVMLAVQKTANAALADDGDYAVPQLSQHGYLKVTVNAIRDAAVAIGAGAMDGGTQRVNLASDDPAVALLGTIDADTSKIPSQGTANMAGSTPVTLATDDTQFGAVGAAADPDGNIHGQLRSVAEEANARNTGATSLFDSDGDNTAQAVKAGAGKLFKMHVYNPNGVACFVQIFDLLVAGVTVGVTAPSFVLFVPAQGAVTEEFSAVGMNCATGITYACTLTPTGAGDPTTGLTVSALYK